MEKENKEMQDLVKKALSTLKMTIDELEKLSEPKQPFKDGDALYYVNQPSIIVKVTDIKKGKGYGINYEGEWITSKIWTFDIKPHLWQLSTPEKWLEVCTKEAERLGLVEGAKIKYPWYGKLNYIIDKDKIYTPDFSGESYIIGNEFIYKGCKVMQDGIWATVLPSDKTLDQLFNEMDVDTIILNEMKANP